MFCRVIRFNDKDTRTGERECVVTDDDFPVADGAPAQADSTRDYLAGLNSAQREAVETTDGPVLVLAGAGTGKTRVLTTRLAHILMSGRAFPGQVLAVTFTNKAAQEMKARVGAILNDRTLEAWWMGTFHSIAARMLRRGDAAARVGLSPDFVIIDSDDQLRVIKQIAREAGLDDKIYPPKRVLATIQRWKDRGLCPDKVSVGEIEGDLGGEGDLGPVLKLYRVYQDQLRRLNACDFGDLLLYSLSLFQAHPDLLADYHRRFRYILVDEYQDTNVAQYLWLRLLAQGHRNICCVGDDDQSIYGWRGAEVGNILKFEQDFPGAAVIRLEQNYRSTGRILAAASAVIGHNAGRLGKTLWTEDAPGEKLHLRGLWDGAAEARFVGETIEDLQRQGHALSDLAILVRAGAQTREFEERFLTLGLPYRVVGGLRFYERLEIRDAIAYLRVIHAPEDGLAFERVLNKPKRGLGPATLAAVQTTARERDCSLFGAAQVLAEGAGDLRPAARKALASFVAQVTRWQSVRESLPPAEVMDLVLDDSGLVQMWEQDKSPDAPGRLDNLRELVTALGDFETLADFLDHVALVMDTTARADQDMVSLMTIHGAKGLEFKTVFLPGWEEGLFPSQRSVDELGQKGLEEERRLAYVAITRARERIFLSYTANRRLHGSWNDALPSCFLDELPGDHILREDALSSHFSQASFSRSGFSNSGADFGTEWRETPGLRRARDFMTAPPAQMTPASEGFNGDAFDLGARVFHQKFGYGTVCGADGPRLTIAFDKAGEKKILASFVLPQDRSRQ